jgi:hypothetical protein
MNTKSTSSAEPPTDDELLPEYALDYAKARPNRFAGRLRPGSRVVVLDPDVAEFFTTPDQVNTLLRAIIATVPARATG